MAPRWFQRLRLEVPSASDTATTSSFQVLPGDHGVPGCGVQGVLPSSPHLRLASDPEGPSNVVSRSSGCVTHKTSRRMIRNSLASVTLILIAACSSGPPVYKSKTTRGCGIAEYNLKWVDQAVQDISWSGGCDDGLASGQGVMVLTLKDGRKETFNGRMFQGRLYEGELTLPAGHVQRGLFHGGGLTRGQFLRPDGSVVFDGEFANNMRDPSGKQISYRDQRYYSGRIFFSDGGRIEEGRFDNSAGVFAGIQSIDGQSGRGIIWGKYYKDGSLVYRWVNGRLFDSDEQYASAVSSYIAEEKRALDRERDALLARQREKEARETREALAQLNSSLAAMAGKPAAVSSPVQPGPRTAPTPTPSPAGQPSGVVSAVTPQSAPAMQCVSVVRPSSGGWAEMHNRCSHAITVSWCYTETSDCKRGTWGYTNTGNIAAGGVRKASTFISQAGRHGLAFAACTGRDVSIQETGPNTFVCK
jgi:hypothetical protein